MPPTPQLLDLWEAFQFERSQASEFLLSKRHAIVPKLQQLMAAALAELEGLIGKALSSPFMDPAQEQKSMENQLIALGHQFQDTTNYLSELHHAYTTFTGTQSPRSLHPQPVSNHPAERRGWTQGPVTCVPLSKFRGSRTFIRSHIYENCIVVWCLGRGAGTPSVGGKTDWRMFR